MILSHLTGFLRKHGCIPKGAPNSRSYRRRGRRPSRNDFHVVTLDPNKFSEKKQQRLDIGNLEYFRPFVSLDNRGPIQAMRLFCDPFSRTPNGRHSPSPPDTKAFLYFSTPPGKPRIAGELRLRVASSDDYASFESGSDLESNGQPWSLPLCTLSKYSTPNILYEKLREEQLVPNDLDKVLSSFPDRCLRYRQVQVLYTLNDTFIANFGPTKRSFNIITEQGAETLLYSKVFFDWRIMSHPYTGNALARFERSTLPEHKGTRTVVLRFLKIVTPVKCVLPLYDSHIVPPQEGELYRRTLRSFQQRVWSVNIDKQKCGLNQRLRLLWEA